MTWFRFLVILTITIVLHSLLDNFAPRALARLDLYVILIVYFAMDGQLTRVIVAGVIAGLTQDAFAGTIFGLHAFALTLTGYLVALLNTKIVLRGAIAFGPCLAGAVLVNEIVILFLIRLLLSQRIGPVQAGVPYTIVVTSAVGVLAYQILESVSASRSEQS